MLRPIVERSKLCLDHASTLYILHGILCIGGGGGPSSVLNLPVLVILVICCIVTAQVGRHLCMQVELLPIPLGGPEVATTLRSGGLLAGGLFSTRLRACLPLLTGTIARIMAWPSPQTPTRTSSGGNEAIPLKTLPLSTTG